MERHLTVENTVNRGVNVQIYLDGVEMRHIVEAHLDEGWIDRVKVDQDGNLVAGGKNRDELVIERLWGVVTAEIIEGA